MLERGSGSALSAFVELRVPREIVLVLQLLRGINEEKGLSEHCIYGQAWKFQLFV